MTKVLISRDAFKSLLQRPRATLARRRRRRRPFSMAAGLERAALSGLQINTVIDVGAAAGTWTETALKFFPAAQYLLLEPLQERESELQILKAKYSNVDYVMAAAGEKNGEVSFCVTNDLDGSGVYDNTPANRKVKLTSIDQQISDRRLPPPFLCKLDTHGFEAPILQGALQTLKHTALLIIETYNFKISQPCLRFHELVAKMENLGFRVCDLVDPLLRDRDRCFWQMDLFFRPAKDPIFNSNSFH